MVRGESPCKSIYMVVHMFRHVESLNSRLHGETCYLPCKPDLHGASHVYMVDQNNLLKSSCKSLKRQPVAANSGKQQQTAATGGKQEQNTSKIAKSYKQHHTAANSSKQQQTAQNSSR